jgi:hypothetical protein
VSTHHVTVSERRAPPTGPWQCDAMVCHVWCHAVVERLLYLWAHVRMVAVPWWELLRVACSTPAGVPCSVLLSPELLVTSAGYRRWCVAAAAACVLFVLVPARAIPGCCVPRLGLESACCQYPCSCCVFGGGSRRVLLAQGLVGTCCPVPGVSACGHFRQHWLTRATLLVSPLLRGSLG